ncbi:MAG: hypothetical protein QOH11_3176 [Solirubrobacteraceae bacterium]|nr:hypothetical protein [Solirubrobacteraceae bacterium]
MLAQLRRHVTFANIGVIVALVLAGSGFAVAAIPGPGGVIQACFNRRTGILRVIDSKRHCTRSERAIRWNQQGKVGTTGAPGATGPAGRSGSDAQFNGAAAGGDLTGAYPSPAIASGAVTAAKVAPDSLTGTEINESTLGQVPDAAKLGGVFASQYVRGFAASGGTAPPGTTIDLVASGIQVNVTCSNSPSLGNQISVSNNTGSNLEVFIDDSRNLTTTAYTAALASGSSVSTDVDTAANALRRLIINTVGGGHGTVTAILTVVRRTSPQNFCTTAYRNFT